MISTCRKVDNKDHLMMLHKRWDQSVYWFNNVCTVGTFPVYMLTIKTQGQDTKLKRWDETSVIVPKFHSSCGRMFCANSSHRVLCGGSIPGEKRLGKSMYTQTTPWNHCASMLTFPVPCTE